MDFTTMDIATITHSVRGDGVRYLQLFLQEYTSIFNETVNPGCPLCLATYLARYKNHFNVMENNDTSHYRLHPKYENIPLEFGSPILVNNSNITHEYAQKLLTHKNGERYFANIPTQPAASERPASAKNRKPKKTTNPKNQAE